MGGLQIQSQDVLIVSYGFSAGERLNSEDQFTRPLSVCSLRDLESGSP